MPDDSFDPYTPPTSINSAAGVPAACYRQGPLFIVPRESARLVPCDTCVRCGRPTAKVLHRNLYYYHPALFLLLLLNLLIFVIVVLVVQKKMRISVGVCEQHLKARRHLLLWTWAAFLLALATGFGLAWMPGDQFTPGLLTVGGLVVAGLVISSLASRYPVKAKHITDHAAEVAGAGEAYLQQFPGR